MFREAVASLGFGIAMAAGATVAVNAGAAETRIIHDGTTTFVALEGEIHEGDDVRFDALVKDMEEYVVMLHSPGGDVAAALSIGATIRQDRASTYVPSDMRCNSACALVWLSGSRRVMAADASIGFHASYRMSDGARTEDGMSNAVVGSYIAHLGFPVETVAFATSATPDSLNTVDPSRPGAHGIDFQVLPAEADDAKKDDGSGTFPDSAVFGRWTAFGYPNGNSGMLTSTEDGKAAMFLSCRKGPCRIGFAFDSAKCEPGASYGLAYRLSDAEPVAFDATCSNDDILFADSSIGLVDAFSDQTYANVGFVMKSGTVRQHRFVLVGFDEALASLRRAGYVE